MSNRSTKIKALLSLGLLAGFGTVTTLAAWTGTATATTSITSATVQLGVGANATSATTSTYTVPLSGTAWYPGSSAAALVTVKNNSSVAVSYSMQGAITESSQYELGKAMQVSVRSGGTVTGTAPAATCTGGTSVISKAAGAAFDAPVARPTQLAPNGSESFCVQYTLPTTAVSNLQGVTTKIDVVFTASVGS
ncbi:hypothetical protein [Glutamicibacter sp.]|uniref:hypothetical protein n=1 Tax=Glutamicibacter sp. TaxID=1931995 RepID=UPI0028BEB93D|nr:hypothetical protein [Glutamicibacter sp.]